MFSAQNKLIQKPAGLYFIDSDLQVESKQHDRLPLCYPQPAETSTAHFSHKGYHTDGFCLLKLWQSGSQCTYRFIHFLKLN